MSKGTATNNNPSTAKPASTNTSGVKPTVSRPTSNTNANMEFRGGKPSFTRKARQ